MSKVNHLDRLFNPSSIAVIGASGDHHKAGGRFVKGLLDCGYAGLIYPVNPNASELMGLRNYTSILDLPEGIDLAIIALPASSVPEAVAACAIKKVKFAIVHSAGFSELGDEGRTMEKKVLRLAKSGGTRIIGPNCMGIYVPGAHINNIVYGAKLGQPGSVAFIGQSGWVTQNIVLWGYERGLRFSKIVSIGNQADLAIEDILKYLGEDTETRVISIYIEGLKRGREFFKIAREIAKRKPVIVWKAGRSKSGSRAAASHTGSIAGNSYVFDTVAVQSGLIQAHDIDDLLDLMVGFSCPVWPNGKRIAILCESGGGAVSGSDAAESLGLEVPLLSDKAQKEMISKLTGVIPPFAPPRNPVDIVWGPADNPTRLFVTCGRIMLSEMDAMVMLDYQRFDDEFAKQIAGLRDETMKPILMVPGYVTYTRPGMAALTGYGVPTFHTTARALRVLSEMVNFTLRKDDS